MIQLQTKSEWLRLYSTLLDSIRLLCQLNLFNKISISTVGLSGLSDTFCAYDVINMSRVTYTRSEYVYKIFHSHELCCLTRWVVEWRYEAEWWRIIGPSLYDHQWHNACWCIPNIKALFWPCVIKNRPIYHLKNQINLKE